MSARASPTRSVPTRTGGMVVACRINFSRRGFWVTPTCGWRFKAIHDSYKYCAPENAPSRARPGPSSTPRGGIAKKGKRGRGAGGKRGLFSTLACPLYGYSDYIVDLGFIVRPAPWALSHLFEGRRFTPFHRHDFPRRARSIERKRTGWKEKSAADKREANRILFLRHAVSKFRIICMGWIPGGFISRVPI